MRREMNGAHMHRFGGRRRAVRVVIIAGVAGGVLAGVPRPAQGHDEDWRKLADRLPAVPGEVYRSPNPNERGVPRGSGFGAQGVTLLSHIPLNQFPGGQNLGNDCWGYVSPSGREYAIMGLEKGFGFVEITDPTDPQIIEVIPGPSSVWHDIKVIGNWAYGVSEGGAGVQCINIGRIDAGEVVLTGNILDAGHSTTHNIVANEEAGTLYLAGANIGNGGLIRLDLTEPGNPQVVGGWTQQYVHDAQVVTWQGGEFDGREIAFLASGLSGGWTQTGLRIVDMTDPLAPELISTLFYPRSGYSHQLWLSDDRSTLYLNDELDESDGSVATTTTRVIDVTDLRNPVVTGSFTTGKQAIDHNLYTRGDYLFQANYRSGLRVFDATDPKNPQEIAYFDTFPGSDAAAFNGAWSVFPYYPSGNVIVSDIERGLFVLRVDAIDGPRLRITQAGVAPELLAPIGGDTFAVTIESVNASVEPGTVDLTLQRASGDVVLTPSDVSGQTHTFTFPALTPGERVSWFVTAETTDRQAFTYPFNPSDAPLVADVAVPGLDLAFTDDFTTNQGWSVFSSASDGQWQRAQPSDTSFGAPPSDAQGDGFAYVTDNAPGNSDVDGGSTTLTSPVLNTTGGALVTYQYWFNDIANSGFAGGDNLTVEVSFNNGFTWTEANRHDTPEAAWRPGVVRIPPDDGTSATRVRFSASDNRRQNILECGVDAVEVRPYLGWCPTDANNDGSISTDDLYTQSQNAETEAARCNANWLRRFELEGN